MLQAIQQLHQLHLVQVDLTGSHDIMDPVSVISQKVHDALAKPIEIEIFELLKTMYWQEINKRNRELERKNNEHGE